MYRIHPISIFFFCLALAGTLACCNNAPKGAAFELSSRETLNLISNGGYWLTPEEARTWQSEQDAAYRFIDIRPAIQFDKGSLEGAINIPLQNLLDVENRGLFSDEGTIFVLFGETETDAHGAWMLLRQMGYENTLLLQGGYTFQQQPDSVQYLPSEQARYNYAALLADAIQRDKNEEEAGRPKAAPQPVVKAPRQIIPKKKAKAKEEEEGC